MGWPVVCWPLYPQSGLETALQQLMEPSWVGTVRGSWGMEAPPRSHLVHQVSLQAELCFIQFPKGLADFLTMTSEVRQRGKGFDIDSVWTCRKAGALIRDSTCPTSLPPPLVRLKLPVEYKHREGVYWCPKVSKADGNVRGCLKDRRQAGPDGRRAASPCKGMGCIHSHI